MTERGSGRGDDRAGWNEESPVGGRGAADGRALPPLDPEPVPPAEPSRVVVEAEPIEAQPGAGSDPRGRPLEVFGDAPERSDRPSWQALGPAFAPRRFGNGRVVVWGCSPGCIVASLLASLLLTLLLNAAF